MRGLKTFQNQKILCLKTADINGGGGGGGVSKRTTVVMIFLRLTRFLEKTLEADDSFPSWEGYHHIS